MKRELLALHHLMYMGKMKETNNDDPSNSENQGHHTSSTWLFLAFTFAEGVFTV